MRVKELLDLYKKDSLLLTAAEAIKQASPQKPARLWLKGLAGSLDSVAVAALFKITNRPLLWIARDNDEAAYLKDDLDRVMEQQEVLYFPYSYKKPYQYQTIDNANVLQRAETLHAISNSEANMPWIAVAPPSALAEKVVNHKSLVESTLTVKSGDKFDIQFHDRNAAQLRL